ncbi:MAG: phosphatase PAP2 family protein [Anaerolineales bacterium]|jgi:membrane-associated phospholipid phosphatase
MPPILEWGIPVIAWLQSLGSWLTPIMKTITFLGDEQFYLLILPVFLWWIDIGLGIRIGLALLLSAGINGALKLVFGLPRPYWVSREIRALSSGTSFGLPSGHSQNAVVLWGRIAALVRRSWLRILLVVLILLIGVSRAYLGVHFPTDILIGWAIGLLILWLLVMLDEPIRRWLAGMSLTGRLMAAASLSLLVLLLGLLAYWSSAGRIIPPEWAAQAAALVPGSDPIEPQGLTDTITAAGTLLGLGIGAVLLVDWGGYAPRTGIGVFLLRYAIGLAGLLGLYLGLRAVFPSGHTPLAYLFRYIRYAAVGLWVTYLAPRIFAWVGLNGRSQGPQTI